jgi:hypothetical protein
MSNLDLLATSASSLVVVNVEECESLQDIFPLSLATAMRELYCGGTQVSAFAPLGPVANTLEVVQAGTCRNPRNITALAQSAKLRQVGLHGTPILSIEALNANTTTLQEVNNVTAQ